MKHPLVTVVIPAYNAAKTIRRALDSIFIQDYAPIEVIVINDGSQDETGELVSGYARREIRLHNLPQNMGVSAASNVGVVEARGKYIAFLDADDEWLPAKLHRQIDLLEANPRAVLANGGRIVINPFGVCMPDYVWPPPELRKDQVWRALLRSACLVKSCLVARTETVREVGGFDTTLPVAEDQDLWIKLALKGEVEFVEDFLVHAYDTPDSLTKIYGSTSASFVLTVVLRHIHAMRPELSPAEIRHILAERYTSIGRNLYANGSVFSGARYILRGLQDGRSVGPKLWYLVTASPLARGLKWAIWRNENRVS
jgi:glycosyltransferase involved in cell wall biosynthesis